MVTDSGLTWNMKPDVLAARVGLSYAFGSAGAATDVTPLGSWSGVYFGGDAGWATADTREVYGGAPPYNGTSWDAFGASNGNVGGFLGINQQVGAKHVVGIELAGSWMGLNNFDTYSGLLWGRVDWMASLDARAGVLLNPRTLAYIKVGAGLIGFSSNYPDSLSTIGPTESTTFAAIQVGVGMEAQFAPHWTTRVEGVYTMAPRGLEFADTTPTFIDHFFRPQIVSGTVGVAYHY